MVLELQLEFAECEDRGVPPSLDDGNVAQAHSPVFAQDRVVSITNMEGQTATINYLIGPLVASVTRFDGTVVSNQYDSSANLVAQTVVPHGVPAVPALDRFMSYRNNGQLTTISNSTSSVTYTYDAYGRVSREIPVTAGYTPVWPTTNTLQYLPSGHITSSIGGTRKYDAAGRLTEMQTSSGKFTWTYDPIARKTTIDFFRGFVV